MVYAKGLVKAGETVVGPSEGLPTWLADIMVEKKAAKGYVVVCVGAEERGKRVGLGFYPLGGGWVRVLEQHYVLSSVT